MSESKQDPQSRANTTTASTLVDESSNNNSNNNNNNNNLSTISTLSAKQRLDLYNDKNNNLPTANREREEAQYELEQMRTLVPLLAKRAYHLEEDNGWCQDWIQYQRNTHPVFGLCMYHRFHPIRLPQRIIILVGSIAFGFAITNCVYLGFLSHEAAGRYVNTTYDAADKVARFQQRYTSVELDQSMVFLLTVGSFLHSMFDISIWYLMACFCCRPGGPCERSMTSATAADDDGGGGSRSGNGGGWSVWSARIARVCQNFGIYAAVSVVVVAVVAATGVAIARLTRDQSDEARLQRQKTQTAFEDLAAEQLDLEESDDASASDIAFLVGYALELVFALFVFYFVTSTVFFSGILGCGRIPFLGGRPYEIRRALRSKDDGDDDGDNNDGRGDDDEYIEEEGREIEYVDEESRGTKQAELGQC